MDFDFKSWNAKVDEAQSFKPGTPEFTRRIKDEMEKSKLFIEKPTFLNEQDKEKKKEDNSGCIIATACLHSRGLDDNCTELIILRRFRDEYVGTMPVGQMDIHKYYEIAPRILVSISGKKEYKQIYDVIYEKMILPVINLIEEEKLSDAYALCKIFLKQLRQAFL